MAVDAHHLLHTGGAGGQRQQLLAHAGWAWAGDGACYEAPAQRSPCYGYNGREAVVAAGQQGFQHPCVATTTPALTPSAAAAGQLVVPGQQYAPGPIMCAVDVSESGVTFGGGGGGGAQTQQEAMAPRKRKRGADQGKVLPMLGLGAEDVAAHFQQQLLDVDRLVLQHTTKMWADLKEQRRRHARQVVAAVEAAAAKRLRAKDEEIERIGRLNWALEERVRSLYVEAQVWRDLAQSNEAAANALRGELQQALDAQQARGGALLLAGAPAGATGTDDAESCCCGENDVAGGTVVADDDEAGTSGGGLHGRRACTVCGEGAAEVLMLPCRHLCACAACAAAARACPACGCAKNGSVCVNFS